MSDYLDVPGFPGVRVGLWCGGPGDDGIVCLKYTGWAEALIQAGVATKEMVTRGGDLRRGPRKRRVDSDGHHWGRDHYWSTGPDGEAMMRWAVYRNVPVAKALAMPCGRELLEAWEADRLAHAAWKQATGTIGAPRPAAPRPVARHGNVIEFPRARKADGIEGAITQVAAELIARREQLDDD